MAESENLRILNHTIMPGENVTLEVELPKLFSHSLVHMPIKIFRALKPGPRFFITSAVHGDEINGIDIIAHLLKSKTLDNLLCGDILLMPVVNVYGFLQQSRYMPDRRDLNRIFPGNPTGSLGSQLADFVANEIIAKCTHGIDLHSGAKNNFNLPQVRITVDHPICAEMAEAFAPPLIIKSEEINGSLRKFANEKGIHTILFEGSEASRFDFNSCEIAARGINNILHYLGMIEKPTSLQGISQPFISNQSNWQRSPESGIFRTLVKNGEEIHHGQVLGNITNLFGENVIEIKSLFHGLLIGQNFMPTVNKGDALFHIAQREEINSLPEHEITHDDKYKYSED